MRAPLCLFLCGFMAAAQPSALDDAMRKADVAFQRRDFAAAVDLYRMVVRERPDLTRPRIQLAAALVETGDLDGAIAMLQPVAARPGVRRNLAMAYYRKPDLPAAIAEFEKLGPAERSDPMSVSVWSDCYLRAGRPAMALQLLEPAAKLHAADARLQYQLGMARLRTGDAPRSLEPLESAGRLGRNPDAYLLAGATALETGEFQRARNDLELAVRLDPKIPGAWTWVGMARDRVGDEEGAKKAYQTALQIDPRDFEANLHYGGVLYRERALDTAMPYLERALALHPASNLARYAIALVRAATGRDQEAVRDLEAVTAAEPEWLEPHVKLASLYFRQHREQGAAREQAIVDKLQSEHREKRLPLPEAR
jgi:tetratricopeptide (TPR) repeat protein